MQHDGRLQYIKQIRCCENSVWIYKHHELDKYKTEIEYYQ